MSDRGRVRRMIRVAIFLAAIGCLLAGCNPTGVCEHADTQSCSETSQRGCESGGGTFTAAGDCRALGYTCAGVGGDGHYRPGSPGCPRPSTP